MRTIEKRAAVETRVLGQRLTGFPSLGNELDEWLLQRIGLALERIRGFADSRLSWTRGGNAPLVVLHDVRKFMGQNPIGVRMPTRDRTVSQVDVAANGERVRLQILGNLVDRRSRMYADVVEWPSKSRLEVGALRLGQRRAFTGRDPDTPGFIVLAVARREQALYVRIASLLL